MSTCGDGCGDENAEACEGLSPPPPETAGVCTAVTAATAAAAAMAAVACWAAGTSAGLVAGVPCVDSPGMGVFTSEGARGV